MIRPTIRPLVSSVVRAVNGVTKVIRYAYNLDGGDDRFQLAYRAIDPDGDTYLEFRSPLNINCTIIAQNISNTATSREFQLWQGAGGELNLTFGGSTVVIAYSSDGYELGKFYYLSLVGTTATLAKDLPTNVIKARTFLRGTSREPTAVTLIGCRGAGAGVFGTFTQGPQYDVRINGILWPINERDYTIQLPTPTGLGLELITPTVLENPVAKGSQWTYLGDGRWQYVGDGGANSLTFLPIQNVPEAGMLEYEVESYSGSPLGVRWSATVTNWVGDRVFMSVGKKRAYFTSKPEDLSLIRNTSGTIISCIIKNISFKPLGTCNPMTMVNTTPERWEVI